MTKVDRHEALAGKHHSKAWPTTDELLDFGRRVCGVRQPANTIDRLAQAMHATLQAAQSDERIPAKLLDRLQPVWEDGMAYAAKAHAKT